MIDAVGFWGTLVMHRGQGLLWELMPEVGELDDAELCHDDAAGGWQVTRVYANLDSLPADFLGTLRERTSAPVLAADVLDSDAAFVTALGRQTPGWQAWLRLDKALGHLLPPPSPFGEIGHGPDHEREVAAAKARILAETPGGHAAAVAAVQWAVEAGLQPGSLHEVEQALNSEEIFAEDAFLDLLNRLGVATDDGEDPSAPTIVEVLGGLFGRRLNAVTTTPHRRARGERLSYPDMLDLRLDFDGSSVTACGCDGTFTMSPATVTDHHEAAPPFELGERRLTDAATVRYRNFPDLRGVVLRFGDAALFVAAVEGQWHVENAFEAPTQIIGGQQLRSNGWLAG